MNDAAPIAIPPVRQMVQPSAITIIAEEFSFRRNGIDKAHVRTLAQALRNGGGKLDPILLWREIGPSEGAPSGRLILLDGQHRLAAYWSTRKEPSEINLGVPAIVIGGTRVEAMLRALAANSRDALPLTLSERSDAAWRLVRLASADLSLARIAKASGVSSRGVSYMRVRAKEMIEAKATITGEWWRDRKDKLRPLEAEDRLTDTARKAEIIKLANSIREAAGQWPRRDADLVAEALRVAFGHQLKGMAEFLFGTDDEFYDQQVSTHTGTDTADPERGF